MAMPKYPTKWNLKLLYKSDTDPAIDKDIKKLTALTNRFANKWSKRDDYLTDAAVLQQALDEYSQYAGASMRLNGGIYYFFLRRDQDQLSSKVKSRFHQLSELESKLGNKVEFFDLNLAKIDKKLQKEFLADPRLAAYRHYLDMCFKKAQYFLSLEQEQLINLKSQPAYNMWVDMTSALLSSEKRTITIAGKKTDASFEDLLNLMDDSRKTVRDQAAKAFNSILEQYIEVGVNEINAVLTDKKINDELRGYSRPDMSRHLKDDIPSRAVDTLIDTVTAHNEIARDYYRLKARLLGVKKLRYHERNLPYGDVSKKYGYNEAVEIMQSVINRLDPKLAAISERLIKEGQADVYPAVGKQSGAYCMPTGQGQPTYLLLNYTSKLRDVSTLAHEMGHALHFELMGKLPALYYGASTATAEVASNYFEGLVLDELATGIDDEQRLSLLMSKLNDSISSTFRQAAFYQFETDLHRDLRKQGYLSKEHIGNLYRKRTSAYMGTSVSQDPGSENWWLYVSHFRKYFYVYSYVSGMLIAQALIAYTKADPSYISKVKKFLASGRSQSTHSIFKSLGIDINKTQIWQAGIDEIKVDLAEAKTLAKKLGKL